MKNVGALLLVSVLAFAAAAGDKEKGGGVPPGPPGSIVISTTTTTTTTSSPPPPPSPTNSTTSTTTSTTTTTPKPTTTTSKPTTTKPTTTTTTTTKPTTTSTTTAQPTTPKPIDPVGTWTLNYTESNRTCLILQAELSVELPYKVNNTNKSFLVSIPSTATVLGSCQDITEDLTLSFAETNSVGFIFNKTKDNKFSIGGIVLSLNVTYPGNNDTTLVVLSHNISEFSTPVSSSYKCLKEQTLNLTSWPKLEYGGLLRISHLQLQAFRNATNTKFDEALDCASSDTPDAVPIAVGCALAALVVVVLVAYLIGRRRSQARGYLSM